MKSSCKIYSFLRAVRGNWRNAIFVSCDCGDCMCGRATPCSGFLLAVDECGQIIPGRWRASSSTTTLPILCGRKAASMTKTPNRSAPLWMAKQGLAYREVRVLPAP